MEWLVDSPHLGVGNFCLIHVSLVPVLNVVGEPVMTQETPSLLFVISWKKNTAWSGSVI